MNTYLIDFRCYDGTENFEIVMAANEHAAVMGLEDCGIEEILYVTKLESEEDKDEV